MENILTEQHKLVLLAMIEDARHHKSMHSYLDFLMKIYNTENYDKMDAIALNEIREIWMREYFHTGMTCYFDLKNG